MPTYTLRNKKDNTSYDVLCSYDKMQEMLEGDPNLEHVLGTPGFISMHGGTLKRAGSEWRDHLNRIKKASGKDNTIKS